MSDDDIAILRISDCSSIKAGNFDTVYCTRSQIGRFSHRQRWQKAANGGDGKQQIYGRMQYSIKVAVFGLVSRPQKGAYRVAVAAMRTGNEPETGQVSELFLDWDDTPPRRPDGVVLLDFVIEPPEMEATQAEATAYFN